MRRKLWLLFFLLIMVSIIGCNSSSNKKDKSEEEKFNTQIAKNVADNYMNALMANNIDEAKKCLDKSIIEKTKIESKSNLVIAGWQTEDSTEVGKASLFKVKTAKIMKDKPYSLLEEYKLKVSKKDGEYKINDISTTESQEVFMENGAIRVRNKDNVKTQLVVDMSGIPNYAYPKTDGANIERLETPKSEFGIMTLSYSGSKLAISTKGNGKSYVAILVIDDSMQTQGGQGGGGSQSGAEEGGGGSSGKESKTGPREIPIGKKILSIDLLKDEIDLITFSKTEKFLNVQYKNQGGTYIKLYNAESSEVMSKEIEDKFPKSKYDVTLVRFEEENLIFEVKGKTDNVENGKYEIDLKDFKIEKL
ncbi:head-tail adaptor protein [Clostridium sp.]|uniref:head-tail adaptor protein n=1 Tax=Clostridium sp. TaxID=1506 RepID=UPI003464D73F